MGHNDIKPFFHFVNIWHNIIISLFFSFSCVQNAPYLAEKLGLSVIDGVLKVLSEAGYNNQTKMKVMIQSTNSSVLNKIKGNSNYELVYEVDEKIRDAANSTVEDIKSFAHSVVVSKSSVLPTSSLYLTTTTNTVAKLQAFNLPVYVQLFNNEFVSQAWDFFSDPTVEINSFVTGSGINGVITDFPKTAAAYKRKWHLLLSFSFLDSIVDNVSDDKRRMIFEHVVMLFFLSFFGSLHIPRSVQW